MVGAYRSPGHSGPCGLRKVHGHLVRDSIPSRPFPRGLLLHQGPIQPCGRRRGGSFEFMPQGGTIWPIGGCKREGESHSQYWEHKARGGISLAIQGQLLDHRPGSRVPMGGCGSSFEKVSLDSLAKASTGRGSHEGSHRTGQDKGISSRGAQDDGSELLEVKGGLFQMEVRLLRLTC